MTDHDQVVLLHLKQILVEREYRLGILALYFNIPLFVVVVDSHPRLHFRETRVLRRVPLHRRSTNASHERLKSRQRKRELDIPSVIPCLGSQLGQKIRDIRILLSSLRPTLLLHTVRRASVGLLIFHQP